jgi:hypothetical protein
MMSPTLGPTAVSGSDRITVVDLGDASSGKGFASTLLFEFCGTDGIYFGFAVTVGIAGFFEDTQDCFTL